MTQPHSSQLPRQNLRIPPARVPANLSRQVLSFRVPLMESPGKTGTTVSSHGEDQHSVRFSPSRPLFFRGHRSHEQNGASAMTPRLNCQYVQPDMVYAGVDCKPAEAVQHLRELMNPHMTQRLLAQEQQEGADGPGIPAYLLDCQWPVGGAALNVFCTPHGWYRVWDMQMRRAKWLPLFGKRFATKLAPATFDDLGKEIAWMGAAEINDVPAYLQARDRE